MTKKQLIENKSKYDSFLPKETNAPNQRVEQDIKRTFWMAQSKNGLLCWNVNRITEHEKCQFNANRRQFFEQSQNRFTLSSNPKIH